MELLHPMKHLKTVKHVAVALATLLGLLGGIALATGTNLEFAAVILAYGVALAGLGFLLWRKIHRNQRVNLAQFAAIVFTPLAVAVLQHYLYYQAHPVMQCMQFGA